MCYAKSISEDRFPWLMTTKIPPMLQYPVKQNAFEFLIGLNNMFYGLNLRQQIKGLIKVTKMSLSTDNKKKKAVQKKIN